MNHSPLAHRLKLSQLRLLIGIADTGSLLGAAEALHISQPAATKALRQMEQAVGEILVSRGSGGSVLTDTGLILCRRARLVLAELRDVEEELGLWHSGGAGHVTIGALPVATPWLLPEALTSLVTDAPRITVRVIEGNSDSMFQELKTGRIDMLVGRFWPGDDADLLTEVLYESTFRIGVRAAHPLVGKRRLRLGDLMGLQWILPPPGTHTRAALESMFRTTGQGLPPNPVETTSFLVMRSLMLQTDMICPFPVEILHADAQLGLIRFLPLNLDMRLPPVGVVRHAKRVLSPAADTVIERLRQAGARAAQTYQR